MGRHLAREEPPPPKEKPRWRFVVAISGILVLAFVAMAAVATLFPENGPRAVAGPDSTTGANPFPHLPGDPVASGTPGPSTTATPGPSAGATPTRSATRPRGTTTTRPSGPAPPAQLSGIYALLPNRVWAAGFQAEVAISNTTGSAQSWQVTLAYPAAVTEYVTSWIDGSPAPTVQGSGPWTFTGSVAIPAGATVSLRFEFRKQSSGDFNPTACSVNGRSCTMA